ncbi:hypothetical protein T484DRAFT_1793143, partial [Baffinella frigidus]
MPVELLDADYRPVAQCDDLTSVELLNANYRPVAQCNDPTSFLATCQYPGCNYESDGYRCVQVVCNLGAEPRLDLDITTQNQFVYAGSSVVLNCTFGARHGSHDPTASRGGVSLCRNDCSLSHVCEA